MDLHKKMVFDRLLPAYRACRQRNNLNVTIALDNLSQAYKAFLQDISVADTLVTTFGCDYDVLVKYVVLHEFEQRINLRDTELSKLVAQKRKQKQLKTTRREISKLEEERICRKRFLKCLRQFFWNWRAGRRKANYRKDDYLLARKILREHLDHGIRKHQELKEIISQAPTKQDEKAHSNYIKLIEEEMDVRTHMLKILLDCFSGYFSQEWEDFNDVFKGIFYPKPIPEETSHTTISKTLVQLYRFNALFLLLRMCAINDTMNTTDCANSQKIL